MRDIYVIAIVVLVALAVVSFNLAQGRQAYRECLATQERIAKSNDRFSVIGCYR